MKRSILFGVGIGLALTACSDTTGPEGDQLSRAEALVLTANLLATSEGAMMTTTSSASAGVTAKAAGAEPINFSQDHESSHPCPSGGTLDIQFTLDGMVDEEANSFQADLSGSHTHNQCAFPHEGITFIVNGMPRIAFAASVGAVNGEPSQPFTFSLEGGFRWNASDDREGTCPINLNAVIDWDAHQRTVSGEVCGHTISDLFTWSAP